MFLTRLLNRNYVVPELNILLQNTGRELGLSHPNVEIRYLDGNFPFFDKFPLLPHLSHNDGKKLDLSFVYENESGQFVNEKKSVSGYGVFEEPETLEFNQTNDCTSKGYWQYSFSRFMTLGSINDNLEFSESATKALIESILGQQELSKLFIEPHLKARLGLTDSRIRFQGCRAVRHDDHIHIQID